MKKLLFTLCAVLAGFAANAQQHALTLQYVDAEGTVIENSELIVKPGTQTVVYVQVAEMTGYNAVDGFQVQWPIKNVEGAAYDANGAVHLLNYGTNIKKSYFKAGSLCLDGTTFTNGINGDNYRIIATNGEYGCTFGNAEGLAARFEASVADVEGSFDAVNYTIPGNIIEFTVVTSADWDEEYATMDFDEEYCKFSWHGAPEGSKANGNLDLKIINENKLPKDLTGEISVGTPDENGYVTVEYTGDEDVTITVTIGDQNYPVVDGKIQLPDYGEYTLNVTVSAEGYKDLEGEFPVTWTAPAVAPEKPSISIVESDDHLTMTVTVTAAEGCTLIVNNEAVNSNTTTYTVDRETDVYTADDPVEVTAKAVKDGLESQEATDSKDWTVEQKPAAATPVITFEEVKDGDVVTAVKVKIENYTDYTITVNDQPYTAKAEVATIQASYDEAKAIHVEAENDPGYPYVKAENEGDYNLAKLTKKAVAAPEVTPTTGDDAVTLNITWPESDGTHVIKVNGQESTQTSFPRQDEAYDVVLDIYVTEGPTSAESAHYTQTITIPAKEPVTPPTEQTGQPVFVNSPYEVIGTNAIYFELANNSSDSNATIYYQITYPDGTKSEWMVYTGPIACYGANQGGQDGTYVVEAYAQAPGKDPSQHISTSGVVSPKTGIDELMAGKAVANVRYFNMAGQEMQEANGMTIVVTTYTDGTTSAIKVMK